MLQYVTNEEYKNLMGASSVPLSFNKLVIDASNYINFQTHYRVDKDNIQNEVKYVTCLIIDLIDKANGKKDSIGNLKSQNIEGWSETYQTAEEIDTKLEQDKLNTLKIYLNNVIGTDGNPLLYSGVC